MVEPDGGGKTFGAGVINRLKELQYDGQAFILTLPDGCKDPSELHIAAPDLFLTRFQGFLRVARPVETKATSQDSSADKRPELRLVNLADVPVEEVHWLWPGRIPFGKLTILDGDPGLGKSSVTLDIAARLTRGQPMPAAPAESALDPANVVLLTAEDGLGDTIRPRLEAAGACLDKVVALQGFGKAEELLFPISLPMDVATIARVVATHQAKLILIDPLMAYLDDNVQAHNDQSVRRALLPLTQLAEKSGAAVLVVRHLNKQPSKNVTYRGGGSIGIIGVARSGLIVCKDPDAPKRRLLGVSKCNLCQPPGALRYEVIAEGKTSRVVWHGESDADIEKLFARQDKPERKSSKKAAEFLKARLAQGPVSVTELNAEAAEQKISQASLRRAKDRLGIASQFIPAKDGHGGTWAWFLPAPPESKPAG
jgi:hypothetical protein